MWNLKNNITKSLGKMFSQHVKSIKVQSLKTKSIFVYYDEKIFSVLTRDNVEKAVNVVKTHWFT